jgi:hypothetical protein
VYRKYKESIPAVTLIVITCTISSFAQGGTLPSSTITDDLGAQFSTIWGVAKWVMQALLVITAAIVAFKTATSGHGSDKTGGWIGVIAMILIAIGLNFVPTIAEMLFGIKF